jgi:hypothetical protein
MIKVKKSDRIKFKVVVREGTRTATRTVKGFYNGGYEVRFRGYDLFMVRFKEVIGIEKGKAND